MPFDIENAFRAAPPAAAGRWSGFPRYNFVGGNNDAASVPSAALAAAVAETLEREGQTLATYGMASGPQGYRPLREGVARMLSKRAGMTDGADDILIVAGSLQALDLIFGLFLDEGDVVLLEKACYGGALSRLRKWGFDYVGVDLDDEGMRADALDAAIEDVKAAGKRPKLIYTIPTVQNPTGAVMGEARRKDILAVAAKHDLPIFEDDCYAELTFEEGRPKAMRALDTDGRVVYCGTFSKTIAPALRVGFVAADWAVTSRLLSLKSDGGTGAIEQMALSVFLDQQFDTHLDKLRGTLKSKADALVDALAQEFGAAAEFEKPTGGIFLWVTLPEEVDTSRLAEAAGAEGVAINPGAEWATDETYGKRRLRLCFANPEIQDIRDGVAKLAEICHREFGTPVRSGNVARS